MWEGAIHGDAFLAGGALQRLGIDSPSNITAAFHALDWLPTISEIAGAETDPTFTAVDGVSQYVTLKDGSSFAARSEFHAGFSVSSHP